MQMLMLTYIVRWKTSSIIATNKGNISINANKIKSYALFRSLLTH